MKVKSYYLTKSKIVVKDYSNKTIILELNRENIMNVIASLDEQIDYNIENVYEEEDRSYRILTNTLVILTLIQAFFAYLVFASFTHASYLGMEIGIFGSLIVLLYSVIFAIVGVAKIESHKKRKKLYEGREILIDKYNSLGTSLDAELVDVY